MNTFGMIRGDRIVAIIRDARGLAAVQAAFPDIAATLESVPAQAEPGWVRSGETFAAAPPPPPPNEVTNFQARALLLSLGLFDTVNAALQAQGGVAWQAWEYANTLTRNGELVQSMGASLGLTPAQLDDMFRAAAQIEA